MKHDMQEILLGFSKTRQLTSHTHFRRLQDTP